MLHETSLEETDVKFNAIPKNNKFTKNTVEASVDQWFSLRQKQ